MEAVPPKGRKAANEAARRNLRGGAAPRHRPGVVRLSRARVRARWGPRLSHLSFRGDARAPARPDALGRPLGALRPRRQLHHQPDEVRLTCRVGLGERLLQRPAYRVLRAVGFAGDLASCVLQLTRFVDALRPWSGGVQMTTRRYAPEYRRQIVELARTGRRRRSCRERVRVLGAGDPQLGAAGEP